MQLLVGFHPRDTRCREQGYAEAGARDGHSAQCLPLDGGYARYLSAARSRRHPHGVGRQGTLPPAVGGGCFA